MKIAWFSFAKGTGQRRNSNAGEGMKPITGEVSAVLKAADEWVSALEALVAAEQSGGETEAEHEVLDIAGSQLVVAVTRWRSNHGLV